VRHRGAKSSKYWEKVMSIGIRMRQDIAQEWDQIMTNNEIWNKQRRNQIFSYIYVCLWISM
jgi:hypothetical protein